MKKISYTLFLLILAASSFYFSKKQKINIVFIGDSITEADKGSAAPPAAAAKFLGQKKTFSQVQFANEGVSGSTTLDFLPSTGTRFRSVVKAADRFYSDKQAKLIFSIMLGTNDSAIKGPLGSPVSADAYAENMKVIIDSLLTAYPESRFIIHHPIWYSPNTYNNSKYLQEGLTRLQTYFTAIDLLVKDYGRSHPGHVYAGDKKAFKYFKDHHLTHMEHENGQQGIFFLHPNEKGSAELGNFWGKAIARIARYR